MAADLSFGSVPPYYLEVLNILGTSENEPTLDRTAFFILFSESSGLIKSVLSQIWDLSTSESQESLKRTGIFKALAFIALAQHGKTISEKLLLNFSEKELPTPQLGDLQNLKSLLLRSKMKKSGSMFTLGDVLALDNIEVELVPEKKGLFLKHVEYCVTSQRYKTTVKRRYSDFVAFHDILLLRYPFRLVPLLPPKRIMGGNAEFIEERRKSLKRFLNLIARHPMLMEDRTVEFFLTFVGSDVQHKIKDYTRNIPEEVDNGNSVNPFFAPDGGQAELSVAREQMRQVHGTILNLKNSANHLTERAEESRDHILIMGKEFSVLSRFMSTSSVHSESSKTLAQLYPHFAAISQALNQQAQLEGEEVVERQELLLDLLSAYRELGERYDASFSQEPSTQSRINKIPSLRRPVTSTPPSFMARQNEEETVTQSPTLLSWECRKAQALQSFLAETNLVQTYLALISVLLQSMVTIRSTWYKKIATLWDNMHPLVDSMQMFATDAKSPDSPTR